MRSELLSLLLTQTWQIAALAMIVAVVVKLAARNRPHLAHTLWILVLIKCVTPPLWGHSLGVFSQMQTLIGQDSDESTVNTESIVALSVLPAEVTQSHEPIIVEDALVPLTDSQLPQSDIAIVSELVAEQPEFATIQESPTDQEFLSNDSTAQSAGFSWPSLMLWTLVFGAIATLLITVVRCVRALRLIYQHRTTEFDEALNERLQQLAKQLRIRRVPRIVVSDVLFGPAVLGLFRHTIVLPSCLFEPLTLGERSDVSRPINQRSPSWNKQTSEDSRPAARRCVTIESKDDLDFLDPILAHELLHIRRGDLSFGMLQVIAQSLWWFHPAVWFSNRWLSREAERCCDEQVIAELGCSPGQYARSLLAVIESKHTLQPIPVFPGMTPVEITTQRMERIMSLKTGLNKHTPLWCWLAVIALAIVVLPGGVAQTSAEESVADEASTVQDTVSPTSSEIEIAEEPLPGNRPDRVQSIYDASKLITRMAKEQSVDRSMAGELVRALIERWLNSASDSRATLVLPLKVTLDEERLVNISPRKQSRHFIETVSLFEKHGFEAFLVEVQAFELPKPTAESILDATTVVSPVESTPASPSGTETAALAAAPKSNNNVRNKIESDRRIRAMLMSDDQLQAMRAKATDGLVANALQSPMVVVHDGQVTHYRNLGSVEILANIGLDVSVERREQSLFSVKCTVETPVNEHYRGETTTIQSSVALADEQWLVFQSVTKTNPDGTIHSGLIAIRAACVAPANIPQQGEIISRRGYEKIPSKFTVNVIGAVRVPGIYKLDADKIWTLLDALRLAGGLSDDSGNTMTVKRKDDEGNAVLIQRDLIHLAKDIDSNILVGPGDVVVVERAEDDVAETKPIANSAPVFVLCTYPVSDLLIPVPPTINVVAAQSGIKDSDLKRAAAENPSVYQESSRETPAEVAKLLTQVSKADFAPFAELIKASVEPESWGNGGVIVEDIQTLTLVIRQTSKAHDEICTLLSKLRKGMDQNVQITSLLVKLTNQEQLKVIEEHNTLHSLADGKKWALLTPKRSESLTKALLELKPDYFWSPRITTISGQSAWVMVDSVGAMDKRAFSGFKLTVTPQLLPDSSIIRLQHAISIGTDRQPDETSDAKNSANIPALLVSQERNVSESVMHESLVGSGQTLLLLIEQPRPDDDAKSVDHYVLMMTPEHVVEVEQRLDGGTVATDPVYRKPSGRTVRKPEFTPVVPR